MRRFKFQYKETIVTILTENEEFYKTAVKAILEARSEIEDYILHNPDFFTSYEPIECSGGEIINRMCNAAKIAGVGPMAAVAGTIAAYAVEKMIDAGAKLAVVDNGGDIVIHSDRELLVGIYPSKLAFKVPPVDYLAICTSSGKIGHSVSFGKADAATVVARDASVADALATALGNLIGDFGKKELEKTVSEFYGKYSDFVEGILVVKDELVALAGNLPSLAFAESKEDLITKG
ncbi:UPF0280 family protein [Archaeoglobus fulgidus]|uniref:UPF0280 protein AF_0649 n=1 Tax=Archaeoglobus fulgidus (strain ATCC 49558 / DSM 4304 / JCM 9628 / NBRC 100126 / VC-16) TaxID=224325 RepID=Y649_ARCFU|nr:UPF0280 family protein [Archaeoglobus fulgidus]O29608.1 RecName: Full=UPF0280 protein AF_0649 [Archaeoglobus fulgidus DSM 4304]AAB90589.1 conserved hypothetical protein [Archaeoglobus fulgidus DSM 4304]